MGAEDIPSDPIYNRQIKKHLILNIYKRADDLEAAICHSPQIHVSPSISG